MRDQKGGRLEPEGRREPEAGTHERAPRALHVRRRLHALAAAVAWAVPPACLCGHAFAQAAATGGASSSAAGSSAAASSVASDAAAGAPASQARKAAASKASSSGAGAAGAQAAAAAGTSPQGDDGGLEEIVVFGRNTQLLGTAKTATEGFVGGTDLKVRPLLRVAELLETVPGLIAAQHSGSGKANQYFLRGINLDHGTDFTSRVDGMPWNLRSHGHGQGYLNVNGLIPETVDKVAYRKGPYRANVGDFAMAGAAFITTIDKWDRPWSAFEAGGYGWRRIVSGGSTGIGKGVLSIAGQLKSYDGPWQEPDNLKHESAWSKYETPTRFGNLAISLSGYHATWDPTEQIPERVIGSSICGDAYCAIDPTATGETKRWIATANMTGSMWDATLYAQTYDFNMYSNPTYDYQIRQYDKRWTTGGHTTRTLVSTNKLELNVGGEFRYDNVGSVGLDHTNTRTLVEPLTHNRIKEGSFAVFSEATWNATANLRLFGGLRGDLYNFDVVALLPGSNEGRQTDSQISPKVGLAYTVSKNVEVYANWGRGFHTNDARAVVDKNAPAHGLASGTGYEGGARFEVKNLKMTAAYWWLNYSSELEFDGDSNAVVPEGASRRDGYELTFFWKPIDWLGVDAVWTGTTARYLDNPAGPYIPQSVEHSGELGVAGQTGPWEIGARLRYLGGYPLIEDDSLRGSPETTLNIRGARTFGKTTVYVDLLNALGADGKDIVYAYPAFVEGFDPPGLSSETLDCSTTDCRMSRAQEPRTLRFGVKIGI